MPQVRGWAGSGGCLLAELRRSPILGSSCASSCVQGLRGGGGRGGAQTSHHAPAQAAPKTRPREGSDRRASRRACPQSPQLPHPPAAPGCVRAPLRGESAGMESGQIGTIERLSVRPSAGVTDHVPDVGRTAFHALARAAPFAQAVDPGTPGRRYPRWRSLDRPHPLHHVGREAGFRACNTALEPVPRAERKDLRAPRRSAWGVVLLLGREQPARRSGGPVGLHLPHFGASMGLERHDRVIRFTSRRTQRRAAPADFEAAWRVGDELGEARPGSLDFFLVERYCLYSAHKGRLYRARIFHRPWRLHSASLLSCRSTMLESQRLPAPGGEPLLHQQGESLRVRVWPRIRVR